MRSIASVAHHGTLSFFLAWWCIAKVLFSVEMAAGHKWPTCVALSAGGSVQVRSLTPAAPCHPLSIINNVISSACEWQMGWGCRVRGKRVWLWMPNVSVRPIARLQDFFFFLMVHALQRKTRAHTHTNTHSLICSFLFCLAINQLIYVGI